MIIRARCLLIKLHPHYRCLHTAGNYGAISPNHSIYISKSTNPYFNLSLEDWLFRKKEGSGPLLLVYRDEPCVVIGRNQNPWKEVNLQSARKSNIPFIRRRSGGGTVYHDLGNTNYSIHTPRSSFDRKASAEVVTRAVRSIGIDDVYVNERNDICVSGYKVSGSAYKLVNKRAYHHGTMLISTSLGTLGDLLHANKPTMVTKGVASVRSAVRNLCDFETDVTHENFVEAMVDSFNANYGQAESAFLVDEDTASSIPYIREGMDELQTWEWAYGQTPEFTYTLVREFEWDTVHADVHSKHGIVTGCDIKPSLSSPDGDADWQRQVSQKLAGAQYGFVGDIDENAWKGGRETRQRCSEIWRWLLEEMQE
ncbi:Lipoyltransferase and lipoate-protein ligase [Rickenella mellea]|uniref:Putative lipoate-protein ligase A n=1 Tax=Rickenella mellea TaxID=50990 RepID=A0A4V3AZP2_9AGAM|nr:Lipoyltransferase and lipoate-protein ligase [Rickenella mellea]